MQICYEVAWATCIAASHEVVQAHHHAQSFPKSSQASTYEQSLPAIADMARRVRGVRHRRLSCSVWSISSVSTSILLCPIFLYIILATSGTHK